MGYSQDIFVEGYRNVNQNKQKKHQALLDTRNDDAFFNVMRGKIKRSHLKGRKTFNLTKADRIELRMDKLKQTKLELAKRQ